MTKTCQPPYTISPGIIRLISDISEQLGGLAALSGDGKDETSLRLRRINRIRTIYPKDLELLRGGK